MSRLYLAYDGGLAVLNRQAGRWQATLSMPGKDCQCLALDPYQTGRVYCGTLDVGLWVSADAGETWQPTSAQPGHDRVMSVAVSPLENVENLGVVWAGTEPSALFRSENGGDSWHECDGLQDLPSKPTWRFPPRPWTHHVRWIEPDPNDIQRIFAGIELGGVMRSLDGGETWEDRKPGSQHDCHTLRTHRLAPGLVYEAAGGGFAESHDGGESWRGGDEGLRHRYLWGLAADPGDPHVLMVSASSGPRAAHNDQFAEATLYRREGQGPWQPVQSGLPPAAGTRAYTLATTPAQPGVFYAATRRSVFRSADAGLTWETLDIDWPEGTDFTSVNGMVIADSN